VRTYSAAGAIDLTNPFFQPLGTNGRACVTCHQPSDGWSVTPAHIQARFDVDGGLDPIFRPNDGSNSPNADVSTEDARREAYSMLLNRGLFRVGIGVPGNAEFALTDVEDPFGYASASELSLFRRPLPATNLPFLATVMWDGRETFAGQSITFDLSDQANEAVLQHAQGIDPLTQDQRDAIVGFETSLYTAQTKDFAAGQLDAQGALGGPVNLSAQPFYIAINDALSPGFNPAAMTLFNAWSNLGSSTSDRFTSARASVARGEALFNTLQFQVAACVV
jgi:hypothetical protein